MQLAAFNNIYLRQIYVHTQNCKTESHRPGFSWIKPKIPICYYSNFQLYFSSGIL